MSCPLQGNEVCSGRFALDTVSSLHTLPDILLKVWSSSLSLLFGCHLLTPHFQFLKVWFLGWCSLSLGPSYSG